MPTDYKELHYMGSPWEYAETADGLKHQQKVFEIRLNICRAAVAHFESMTGLSDEDQFTLDIVRREQGRLQGILNEIARRAAKAK